LRLPAFIALGVGGLSAGGALVTGVAASAGRDHYDPKRDCGSRCESVADRNLTLTTKILAGVAAAGVGTGVVLLLTAPRTERPTLSPSLGIGVSTQKAVARATWQF
jgi:hypothetical protein